MVRHLLAALVLAHALAPLSAWAGGPKVVATIDRALWPRPLANAKDFDRASFAENTAFAQVFLEQTQAFDEGKRTLPVKEVQTESLKRWRTGVEGEIVRNLAQASRGCAGEPLCTLAERIDRKNLAKTVAQKAALLQKDYPDWLTAARAFYDAYVAEQMRLAALFPKPTSEILKVTDHELLGTEFPDKTFLLTFDDGPTAAGGETDGLAALLRANGISADFFVLHDALTRRLAKQGRGEVVALYGQQCLAVHGKEHKPHPTLATWKESLVDTQSVVASVTGADKTKIIFRPPYGQRNQEISAFVEGTGGTVVLWNIDSQDWHSRITAPQTHDRVLTLMLLWRRGIILFHDIHAKAGVALPELIDTAKKTGVTWQSCAKLAASKP
jgi:peptidoglycan/xylan/chitin deacetylase (PgdA/CDA1 family)